MFQPWRCSIVSGGGREALPHVAIMAHPSTWLRVLPQGLYCEPGDFFIDPVRLQQDMVEYGKRGEPYFAEPGLIILAEVTPKQIEQAVRGLWRQGYFSNLKPLAD